MNNFIRFGKEIINTAHITRMWKDLGEYHVLIKGCKNSISYGNPGKEFIQFYDECYNNTFNKNNELEDKIAELTNKVTELENMIKYLPVVSGEYKNAEEHFKSL